MCRRWACRRHSTSALPLKKGSRCAATLAAQLGQNSPGDHFMGGWIRGHLALGSAFGLGRALAARRLGPQRWSPRDIASGALTHRPALRAARPLLRLRAIALPQTSGRARYLPSLPAQGRVVCRFSDSLASALATAASVAGAEARGRRREAAQILHHHGDCGERLGGVSKGPHGSYL